MRVLFGCLMLAFAFLQLRALLRSDRHYRQQRDEYLRVARIADLPDDEFIAWCEETGRG